MATADKEQKTRYLSESELQTMSRRVTLINNTKELVNQFPSGKGEDFIVKHKIEETGIHILVCM